MNGIDAFRSLMTSHLAIWIVSALAVAGVIIRPFNSIEAVWAVGGATLLVVLGLITPSRALMGVARGTDVYLFLTGMMLLAEVARSEGLFDWLAALATRHAGGSPRRLFLLIYLVGTVVTVFLSNDATAVVLTPAVAAAVRTAKAEQPLPYLLICAFIANAASFVLPIALWCAVSYLPFIWHTMVRVRDPGDVTWFTPGQLVERAAFDAENANVQARHGKLASGRISNPVFLPAPDEVLHALVHGFITPPARPVDRRRSNADRHRAPDDAEADRANHPGHARLSRERLHCQEVEHHADYADHYDGHDSGKQLLPDRQRHSNERSVNRLPQ